MHPTNMYSIHSVLPVPGVENRNMTEIIWQNRFLKNHLNIIESVLPEFQPNLGIRGDIQKDLVFNLSPGGWERFRKGKIVANNERTGGRYRVLI